MSTLSREQIEQHLRRIRIHMGYDYEATDAHNAVIAHDAAQRAQLAAVTQELEEYRSIAETIGAEKAVSQLAQAQQQLAARERAVRKEYEWILKEIVAWGMQTEQSDLDLTTAEFGEIWRGAQKLLKQAEAVKP